MQQGKTLVYFLTFMGLAGCGATTVSPTAATSRRSAAHEAAEARQSPELAALATGTRPQVGDYPRKKWPIKMLYIGHTIASFQDYGDGNPYFHHGLDIRADQGADVFVAAGGKVVNIDNYMPGDLYWEIAIQDDQGFVWQYHHVDHATLTKEIQDAFTNGTRVDEGTRIGSIVLWPEVSFGEVYNHTHLNILGQGGVYFNPFDFLEPLADTAAPQIVDVGLLQNGDAVKGTSVAGAYTVYATIHDLILKDRDFVVPPNSVTYSVDGGKPVTTWEFSQLPGGASETAFVTKLFVPNLTCGDYSCRKLTLDLGFTPAGGQPFTAVAGPHTVVVTAKDYAGNQASQSFSWTVQ